MYIYINIKILVLIIQLKNSNKCFSIRVEDVLRFQHISLCMLTIM
jgi:hypothetical protein